mmetsp:Transcript_127073/g.365481  ORF Transcript_127073/g.365481 Transcript_127073/m.365481 type:complete len:516 (+) Transcript_127073:50-1597(+)
MGMRRGPKLFANPRRSARIMPPPRLRFALVHYLCCLLCAVQPASARRSVALESATANAEGSQGFQPLKAWAVAASTASLSGREPAAAPLAAKVAAPPSKLNPVTRAADEAQDRDELDPFGWWTGAWRRRGSSRPSVDEPEPKITDPLHGLFVKPDIEDMEDGSRMQAYDLDPLGWWNGDWRRRQPSTASDATLQPKPRRMRQDGPDGLDEAGPGDARAASSDGEALAPKKPAKETPVSSNRDDVFGWPGEYRRSQQARAAAMARAPAPMARQSDRVRAAVGKFVPSDGADVRGSRGEWRRSLQETLAPSAAVAPKEKEAPEKTRMPSDGADVRGARGEWRRGLSESFAPSAAKAPKTKEAPDKAGDEGAPKAVRYYSSQRTARSQNRGGSSQWTASPVDSKDVFGWRGEWRRSQGKLMAAADATASAPAPRKNAWSGRGGSAQRSRRMSAAGAQDVRIREEPSGKKDKQTQIAGIPVDEDYVSDWVSPGSVRVDTMRPVKKKAQASDAAVPRPKG